MKRTLFEGKFLRLLDHNSWEFVERKNCTGIVIVLAMTEQKNLLLRNVSPVAWLQTGHSADKASAVGEADAR